MSSRFCALHSYIHIQYYHQLDSVLINFPNASHSHCEIHLRKHIYYGSKANCSNIIDFIQARTPKFHQKIRQLQCWFFHNSLGLGHYTNCIRGELKFTTWPSYNTSDSPIYPWYIHTLFFWTWSVCISISIKILSSVNSVERYF